MTDGTVITVFLTSGVVLTGSLINIADVHIRLRASLAIGAPEHTVIIPWVNVKKVERV